MKKDNSDQEAHGANKREEKMNTVVESFLLSQTNKLERSFWDETSKTSIILSIETAYRKDLLSEYGITDIVINGEKILVKWEKRVIPLTREQIQKKYGRDDK